MTHHTELHPLVQTHTLRPSAASWQKPELAALLYLPQSGALSENLQRFEHPPIFPLMSQNVQM